MPVGAIPDKNNSTFFRVWAPFAANVYAEIGPEHERVELSPCEQGYFEKLIDGIGDSARYRYILNEAALPDPASRFQPDGVHGPSAVVDHSEFTWKDNAWKGIPIEEYTIYELHVGTFTPQGTFGAVADTIPYFKELGINAVEIMPVGQFPGGRNWGYDGTYPYAPQNTYGGPHGLKSLVDACHINDIAVILDVVYNHLGPEGNYTTRFGPYFTDRYRTPWGDAINFDGPLSDEVRNYFIFNALEWFEHYHFDALRLDAIHGIFDFSAKTFLEELAEEVRLSQHGRRRYLIAECDLNNVYVITPQECGGIGIDAQWNDDFHHALHCVMTRECDGYYQDFGSIGDIAKSLGEGYVYTGQFSRYRQKRHGRPLKDQSCSQFVIFSQNHDQIGNRAHGERLSGIVSHDKLRLAAAATLFSPCIPLLFMGEEYGDSAPFQYFVSHSDKELIEAVRKGRAEEFSSFHAHVDVPDPESEETFLRSKINRELRFKEPYSDLYRFYKHILELRRQLRPWELEQKWPAVESWPDRQSLCVHIDAKSGDIACMFNFAEHDTCIAPSLGEGSWIAESDSLSKTWGARGEKAPGRIVYRHGIEITLGPYNAVIYRKEV
jgi:maltooligosyltrehalose trehalohydrolase